jgi:peptide/nickel transport system ATP-binding protein
MKEELIKLINVSYSLDDEKLSLSKGKTAEILFNIDLTLYEDEVLGICGESGGGKSTLAKVISGIVKPVRGQLKLNPKIVAKGNKPKKIQILFQNNSNLLNPYRKVDSLIDEAIKLSGIKIENMVERKEKLFSILGIESNLASRKGYELSGGERQRIALARLLAVNPEVLILDEPFSAQDITSQINLVKVLKRINEELDVTMICISHDLKILRKFAHKVIVLQNGRIVETGDTSKIFSLPTHPYTKFLLSAEEFSLTEEAIHNFNS